MSDKIEKKTSKSIIQIIDLQKKIHDWENGIVQKLSVFDVAQRDHISEGRLDYHKIHHLIEDSRKSGEVLGVFFLNLDRLKLLRQRWSPEVICQLLNDVGLSLLNNTRSKDMVAKVSEDQFIVFIRNILSEKKAENIAERLLGIFEKPFCIMSHEIMVMISLGISLYPFDGDDLPLLLTKASSAMFSVKVRGGSSFDFYDKRHYPFLLRRNKSKNEKTIMVIDDDVDFQKVLLKTFQHAGYDCSHFLSVEEALQSLKKIVPDLVMLDLNFKKASGLAFLENFTHVIDGEKVPPVVVVSGYSDSEIVNFVKSRGATQFISKPVNSSDIISAVHNLLQSAV